MVIVDQKRSRKQFNNVTGFVRRLDCSSVRLSKVRLG
jgi:hypothetical protein